MSTDAGPSGALRGRRALVVGGGSGIGLGVARQLAADGATVTIVGRTAAKLERAPAELAAHGLDVAWTTGDALDGPAVRAAVEVAADDDGRPDIAVVVPGGGAIGSVLLCDDDAFSRQVDQNVRPVFLTLEHAGHAMVRNGSVRSWPSRPPRPRSPPVPWRPTPPARPRSTSSCAWRPTSWVRSASA